MTADETLEYVRLRCHCAEDTGCWTWKGYSADKRFPQVRINNVVRPTRRVVWVAAHGAIRPQDWISAKCDDPLCVAPGHLRKSNRSKRNKGKKIPQHVIAKRVATLRAKSKLTVQDVLDIRASTEKQVVLAKRYGISHDNVSCIVNHQTWKNVGNPFAGLMR